MISRCKHLALWGLCGLGLMSLGIMAFRHSARPPVVIVTPSRVQPGVEPATSTDGSTSSDTKSVGPAPDMMVHVSGEVASPGVYKIPPGSRVIQALEAAGGPLASASLDKVNLALPVRDGEQVYIPGHSESSRSPEPVKARVDVFKTAPEPSGVPGSSELIDINRASQRELEGLPGIGPALASRIVEYREANGRFTSVDDLVKVSGIGPAKLATLRPHAVAK